MILFFQSTMTESDKIVGSFDSLGNSENLPPALAAGLREDLKRGKKAGRSGGYEDGIFYETIIEITPEKDFRDYVQEYLTQETDLQVARIEEGVI